MRNNSFLLPALGMGLLNCSLAIGAITQNLSGAMRSGGGFTVYMHLGATFLCGVLLYCAAKRGWESRPLLLAAPAFLLAFFTAAFPFLPNELRSLIPSGSPTVGIAMGFFIPLGLTLFFRATPAGQEGFFYGVFMALGEFLWIILFPLLEGAFTELAPGGRAFHMFSMNSLTIGGTGLCLALALSRRGKTNVAPQPPHKAMRPVLLWVFAAGIGIYILMGLVTGMAVPKMLLTPGLRRILPHCILICLLPLVGIMLDGNKTDRLSLLLILLCLFVPFFALIRPDPLIQFSLLSVARQALLLTVFTTAARLLKTRAILPLVLALAHCLYLAQFPGALARNALDFPFGVFTAALALAAGTAFCLTRFRRLLTTTPGLWSLPEHEKNRETDCGTTLQAILNPRHIVAFGLNHSLSDREIQVMNMLAQGHSTGAIAENLLVKETTVRTYVYRLLQKTGTDSRAALMTLLTVWVTLSAKAEDR